MRRGRLLGGVDCACVGAGISSYSRGKHLYAQRKMEKKTTSASIHEGTLGRDFFKKKSPRDVSRECVCAFSCTKVLTASWAGANSGVD